jgi:hypothetical protein
VAPEFQIANESSVVGYVNYMQRRSARAWRRLADYAALLPLAANDAKALLDELNLVLAGGQLGGRHGMA